MRKQVNNTTLASKTKLTLLLFIAALVLTACTAPIEQDNAQPDVQHNQQLPPPLAEPQVQNEQAEQPIIEEPKPYTMTASLIAVGDIMVHSPQLTGAYDAATEAYHFDSYFSEIQPYLTGDWVIGNLETTLAGRENRGFSGYPEFNSPDELAAALKNAGFNILTTANNHSMDRREAGVLRTLEVLADNGLISVGTHASQEQAEDIVIVTKNEITMAILSYTYGTNGIPVPSEKPYLVNLIDEQKIAEDIQRARDIEEVDIVTVALHMEGEYHRWPNDQQIKLTQFVVEAGADIILGSHPHVVQPYDWIESVDEEGNSRKGLVIYSLGNFISNQGPEQGTAKYTDVGVVFEVAISKQFPEEIIDIEVVSATSTWVHKFSQEGKRQYRILPIASVLESRNDPLLTDHQYSLLESYLQEMDQHLPAFMSEQ